MFKKMLALIIVLCVTSTSFAQFGMFEKTMLEMQLYIFKSNIDTYEVMFKKYKDDNEKAITDALNTPAPPDGCNAVILESVDAVLAWSRMKTKLYSIRTKNDNLYASITQELRFAKQDYDTYKGFVDDPNRDNDSYQSVFDMIWNANHSLINRFMFSWIYYDDFEDPLHEWPITVQGYKQKELEIADEIRSAIDEYNVKLQILNNAINAKCGNSGPPMPGTGPINPPVNPGTPTLAPPLPH